jgi:carboxyl-terminal processing protease
MKKLLSLLLLAIASLFVFSCNTTNDRIESAEGLWQSLGYGRIFQIEKDHYTYYEHSNQICAPTDQGMLTDFEGAFKVKNDTLTVTVGYDVFYFKRINELPKLCSTEIITETAENTGYNVNVSLESSSEHQAVRSRF